MNPIEQTSPLNSILTSNNPATGLEIAVIGMAGRFPGAQSIDEFWSNLQQSIESIVPLSDEQLLAQGVLAETLADPNYIKVGGVLQGVDLFDAEFFGISPREAEILDPQQRLFLETAVEALETAGYDAERYSGSIGVYGGAGMNGYLLNLYSNVSIREGVSPYELFIANDKDFLTTRVSYKLNLTGPSVDVQTACSSSLVAVHMACQSLLSGECDMALAGGVAVSKQLGYWVQAGSIYAPDGHCRAFDAQAAGTVSGNGVGIVVLKRLADALAEGDTIDAVIKGSAINNDGALKMSYTAPSVEAQAAVIQSAQAMAEVSPNSISYIEAHGTGTALGDPIELAALTQAFGSQSTESGSCAIGSVKTNIGHLDAAAGISGFIKTVLALKHQQIPASLHFQQPNPQIDFNNSPFYVNAALADWPQQASPRRAGVSSFGIGGTNAHVVLEEAPVKVLAPPIKQTIKQPHLLILSAKTPLALERISLNLANHLETALKKNVLTADSAKQPALADVAHTLQMGRRAFQYRRSVVCQTASEAIEQLRVQTAKIQTSKIQASKRTAEQPSLIFLFSGQGSQHVNMARGLYQAEPVFKQVLDQCSEILGSEILGNDLNQTAYTQPALFALEYALAQLWMTWGLKPAALLGHSLGEYVAACLAGVFDLETALELVALRGQLMQQMPSGAMLTVALSAEAVKPWLSDEISLAVSNGPQLCVVSGGKAAISTLQSRLDESNISCRQLHTSHAFHSPMMEPMLAPFVEAVVKASSQTKLHPPTIPFISNVTGTWITDDEATSPSYWGRQIRQTVRFSEGITELLQLVDPVFLEVGPGHALTTLTRQHSDLAQPILAINSLPHPKSENSDATQMLIALGQLWSAGVEINWKAFQGDRRDRRIPLPTYPFERQRYWVDFTGATLNSPQPEQAKAQANIELKNDLADWFYSPSWERCLPKLSIPDPTARPCWLLFLDDTGVGQQLAQQIEQSGQDVFSVCQGAEFAQAGYRQFSLNPDQPEGFQQLLEDLRLREMAPTEIVYLWSLPSSLKQENLEPFVVLMGLLKTWSMQAEALQITVQITVVTEAAEDVIGTEPMHPAQAEVKGLCQVIGQEYPNLGCRQVDWMRAQQSPQQLARVLWQELQVENPAAVVAYRDRHRWQQTYQPIHLPKTTSRSSIRLRQGGLYAVIGENIGIGETIGESLKQDLSQGLGSVWASCLAQHYQANIVFIKETTADTIQQALKQETEKFGPLNGVFFSSPTTNVKSAAPIALLDSHHWAYNCQSKRVVLQSLAIALSGYQLDFCCVQSSLSSIIGGLGLAAYASANHFLDAFVAQQNQNSLFPWFSINWDACVDSSDADSNDSKKTQPGWGSALADFALTPTEVWEATERILTQASPGQIIVSKGDLLARHHKWIHATAHQPSAQQKTVQSSSESAKSYGRPQLSTAYLSPRNDIETTIAAIWQDLLGIEKVGVNDSFFDLGGHSLLAIQAISRLREAFPVALEMRNLLFESPTVAGIGAIIAEQLLPENELTAMAALLAEVQTLSPEEIKAQLAGGDA